MISIVSPVYGSPELLVELTERVDKTFKREGIEYELILVNDACPLGSWSIIQEIASKNLNVKGVNLSRNFGQHIAICAGFEFVHRNSKLVVVMDADLQDLPEEIPSLIRPILDAKVQICIGKSTVRRGKQNFLVRLIRPFFYALHDYLCAYKAKFGNVSFFALSREAMNAIVEIRESQRNIMGLIQYIGFDYELVPVESEIIERSESSYSFLKRVKLGCSQIINNSTKLLKFGIGCGILISFASFIYGLYLIISMLLWHLAVPGWTSAITSTFFMGGVLMTLIGLLGLYIEVIFWESKRRPLYFVKGTINRDVCNGDT